MSSIRDRDTAYKIGFSSALFLNTYSAYLELAKWSFEGKDIDIRRMRVRFCRGYADAQRVLDIVKRGNHDAGIVIPQAPETTNSDIHKELTKRGYLITLKYE